MADTPVVLISGPRQAGKTTLVKQIADQRMHYLTLDEELTLLAAKEDPVGLIREHDYLIVDEVQRAPELILAIKKAVDDDRRPGRFLSQTRPRTYRERTNGNCVARRIP